MSTGESGGLSYVIFVFFFFKPFFDTVWCADDGPGKPHPFMCLEAMGEVGAEPSQTLMIGDAVHDMRMARAAGVRAFGVTWGFGRADELHKAGAHEVFNSFEDLNTALEIFRVSKPNL